MALFIANGLDIMLVRPDTMFVAVAVTYRRAVSLWELLVAVVMVLNATARVEVRIASQMAQDTALETFGSA